MRFLKILLVLPIVALTIVILKVAQYAAVDALGDQMGFAGATLVGAGPIIAALYYASIKFPHLNRFGLRRD